MKFFEREPLHVVVDARTTPVSVLHRVGAGELKEEQYANIQEAEEFTLLDARVADRFAGLSLGASIGLGFFTTFNFLNEHSNLPWQERPSAIPALITLALLGVAKGFDIKATKNHLLHGAVKEAIFKRIDYHETTYRPR